jgi:flagellar M-ring protein FliF
MNPPAANGGAPMPATVVIDQSNSRLVDVLPEKLRPAAAGLKPLLILVGIAAAVAAGVGAVLWSQGPTYSLVFGNLSDADAAQLTQSLDQKAIPWKVENNAVLVPAERVTEARMALAAEGLPTQGGFSLMDKDPGFGVSQFMENARYQHALEQELARTIASLRAVEGARVHLAVPQQSAFVRDRRPVSASVFLKLRSGQRLAREQVASIVNLVASSIPELKAEDVTVVDSQGRLLSAPERENSEFAAREEQLEIAQRIEEEYSQRIEQLLMPLLGPGRVHAQVVAQIEMATTEEAREQYRPDSQVVRSEQTSEETSRGPATNGGVPGALSNQPPETGTALPPGVKPDDPAQAAAAAAPENASRQATRNYEIDRTVAYTRTPAGRLSRLSAAVVIDNLRTTAADGSVKETPLTEQQLERINTLVRDAVGYNEARGDSVSVVNQGFLTDTSAVPEIDGPAIWEHPMFRVVAKLASGVLIILLLLLFVVRPLIKSLTGGGAPRRGLMPALAVVGGPAAQVGELMPAEPTANRSATAIAYEQQIAQARSLVAKDPARVAQVVREWVQKDE